MFVVWLVINLFGHHTRFVQPTLRQKVFTVLIINCENFRITAFGLVIITMAVNTLLNQPLFIPSYINEIV